MIQTIPPQSGASFQMKRGQRLKVIDPEGLQVSDLFCVSSADPLEWLSSGRSIDYADTIYLTTGNFLYSNRSTPMLKILEDRCGRHDFLMSPCSLKMFQLVAGQPIAHSSCDENLVKALAHFEIPADRISTAFNIFMNVEISSNGRIQIHAPRSRAGDFIVFEALIDLVVGITACSHEETNAGICKPIRYEIL